MRTLTRGSAHRRRATKLVSALAVATMVLTACGGGEDDEPTAEPDETADAADDDATGDGADAESGDDGEAAPSGEPISLSVGVDAPNIMTNAPLYVGRELGFFEDAGVDELEITVTQDQFAAALLSGSVDISQAATADWMAAGAQSGEPIRWLATLRDREHIQLGVRPGIETPEDLKGGKVTGGPAGGDNEANLLFVLEELGLEPGTDVEVIPSDPGSDNWVAAVLNGQLDGSMMFGRHIAVMEEAGGNFLYQETRDSPQDGFATTESFMEENPEAVEAFLTGLVATKQYMADLDNRDEIFQIMTDNGFEITDELEQEYQIEVEQQSEDGGFEVEAMERMIEAGIAREQLPPDTDWQEWVNLEPLWAAQEANGLPRRPEM